MGNGFDLVDLVELAKPNGQMFEIRMVFVEVEQIKHFKVEQQIYNCKIVSADESTSFMGYYLLKHSYSFEQLGFLGFDELIGKRSALLPMVV